MRKSKMLHGCLLLNFTAIQKPLFCLMKFNFKIKLKRLNFMLIRIKKNNFKCSEVRASILKVTFFYYHLISNIFLSQVQVYLPRLSLFRPVGAITRGVESINRWFTCKVTIFVCQKKCFVNEKTLVKSTCAQ